MCVCVCVCVCVHMTVCVCVSTATIECSSFWNIERPWKSPPDADSTGGVQRDQCDSQGSPTDPSHSQTLYGSQGLCHVLSIAVLVEQVVPVEWSVIPFLSGFEFVLDSKYSS